MKPTPLSFTLAAALIGASALSGEIIVAWHTPSDDGAGLDTSPDMLMTGITGASIQDGRTFSTNTGRNSDDGSYGSVAGGFSTTAGSIDVQESTNFGRRAVDVTFTNSTGAALGLNAVHFDYNPGLATSPLAFDLSYVAALSGESLGANSVTMASVSGLVAESGYVDYDFALASETDATFDFATTSLADGATVVFRFSVANGPDSGRGFLDNIAVTAVPEPSAFGLGLGLLALGSILMRRRK